MHKWTERDDLVALYIYKHGTSHIRLSVEDIAGKLDIPVASMKMRLQNFRSVDIGGGLPNVAAQTRSVFAKFGEFSEPELRAKVLECFG